MASTLSPRTRFSGLAKNSTLFVILLLSLFGTLTAANAAPSVFQLEEATIGDIHKAIRNGQTTCTQIVQRYINRAKAYNGACTLLVTQDGAPIPQAYGYVRAGVPIKFPTATVPVGSLLPDLNQYVGRPLDLGRMEPTVTDPSVMAQMGMRVGIPNAGQLNALETLNIRGERSQSCKQECDPPPNTALPGHCPAACNAFRAQPDALERAAELDARWGTNPPLEQMPLYCVVVGVKDPYDTKDMRSTSNSDVSFAMDAPPFDADNVARMRAKGAIIYAKTQAHEFNAGPGNPGGAATATTNLVGDGYALSGWSGQSCNPYDTQRVPRGSSAGSGPAVSANLITIGLCEQTGASCQGPASRSGISLLLPTQGLISDSGGQGYQYFTDRMGIHARTLADTAFVLESLRDSKDGYFSANGLYAAIPNALVSKRPYPSFVVDSAKLAENPKPLRGLRIAILREHMIAPTLNHVAINSQIDSQIKTVLRDRLGAQLVETLEPSVPDDPAVPNVTYTFRQAFAELLPVYFPEIWQRKNSSGQPLYAVPGHDVTSYQYLIDLSLGKAPLASNFPNITNISTVMAYPNQLAFKFDMDRYLAKRDDTKIKNWGDWLANAKFRQDESRAGAENWAATMTTIADGKATRMALSDVVRLALMKVMYANKIDAFVHPENTVPPNKIGGPLLGSISLEGITPFLQIPRVVSPAGFTNVIYEPSFVLNASKNNYVAQAGTVATVLPKPLPISITFFAGQGEEPTLIRIGTAYETATRHRQPPPDFGPL